MTRIACSPKGWALAAGVTVLAFTPLLPNGGLTAQVVPPPTDRIHLLSPPHPQQDGHFGLSVTGVEGDLDGDGVYDILVGTWFEDAGGPDSTALHSSAGKAYVFSGADGALIHELQSPVPRPRGGFGKSLAGAGGTLGADALHEFAVGAWFEDGTVPLSGLVHVFDGSTGSLIRTLESPDPEKHGLFGCAILSPGDLDGDNVADLLVGARNEDGGQGDAGRVHAFSGLTGALIYSLESPEPERSGWFGASLGRLQNDVNADGTPDFLIGAPGEDCGGRNAGCVYLVDGGTGAKLHRFGSPNPTNDGAFGHAVAGISDADGDHMPDLLVGAPKESTTVQRSGRAYVLSSADGSVIRALGSPNAEPNGQYGATVDGLGPISAVSVGAGGLPILIGAPGEDAPQVNSGRVYVVNALDATDVHVIHSPSPQADGRFGFPVASLRDDVNGDHRPDIVVGASREGPTVVARPPGRAYVMDPSPNSPDTTGSVSRQTVRGSLFPVPATGLTRLELHLDMAGSVDVELVDLAGRVFPMTGGTRPAGRHLLELNLAAFPPGVYALCVRTAGGTLAFDLIIAR